MKTKLLLMPFISLCISIIAMVPISKYHDLEGINWMENVKDYTKLTDLSIPGTHDSGATHSIFDIEGKCQDLNINQQLKVGTRFFDIRLKLENDKFKIVHGPADQKLKFDKVLKEMVSFVKNNNSEFLLISLKEETEGKNNNLSFESALEETLKKYEDVISFSTKLPATIKDARGKIFIISRHDLSFGYPSYYFWQDDSSFTLGDLYIQDNYCIEDINEKIEDIKSTIDISNQHSNDKLVLNFTSCYLENHFPPTYAGSTAKIINPWLIEYLNENNDDKLGIIISDFMSERLAQSIYRRNY